MADVTNSFVLHSKVPGTMLKGGESPQMDLNEEVSLIPYAGTANKIILGAIKSENKLYDTNNSGISIYLLINHSTW